MKKITFTLALLLFTAITAFGQTPQGINYQAVLRNSNGSIMSNTPATYRFSFLEGSNSGTLRYQETRGVTTDAYGMVNTVIGEGSTVSGAFSNIDWTKANYLKVEVNVSGSYISLGVNKFQSVPYALNAGNSSPWTTSGNNISNSNSGNVGIGNSSPSERLQITKTGNDNYVRIDAGGTGGNKSGVMLMEPGFEFGWSMSFDAGSDRYSLSHYAGSGTIHERMTMEPNGNLGLGTTSPSEKLDVSGNIYASGGDFYTNVTDGVINCGGGIMSATINVISDASPSPLNVNGDEDLYIQDDLELGSNGYKPGGGSWTGASDARLKKNVQDYEDGLAEVLRIRPVTYQYNDHFPALDNGVEYVGVIAQEIKEIAPYMVELKHFGEQMSEDENGVEKVIKKGEEFYTYDASALNYMLINAIQEQQAQIEVLKAKIEALEKE